jgi:hypothetical protein
MTKDERVATKLVTVLQRVAAWVWTQRKVTIESILFKLFSTFLGAVTTAWKRLSLPAQIISIAIALWLLPVTGLERSYRCWVASLPVRKAFGIYWTLPTRTAVHPRYPSQTLSERQRRFDDQ